MHKSTTPSQGGRHGSFNLWMHRARVGGWHWQVKLCDPSLTHT